MTKRMLLLVAVGLCACTSSMLSPARTQEPITINSFGLWTIQQLGFSEIVLPTSIQSDRARVTYYLPQGAAQGPSNWYLLRLHFRLELEDDTNPGLVYVSASTNDCTAAQVKFQIYRTGGLTVHWNTLDLLEGEKNFFTLSPSVEVFFSNYLQTAGVLPGLNALTVGLEIFNDVRVKQLVVYGDSGIEYTSLSPPKLVMQVKLPEQQVTVGDIFHVGFDLTNRGGYRAQGVTVRPAYPQDAFRVKGNELWRFPTIDTEAQGEFIFEALQSGRYQITFFVNSDSGGRPAVMIEANIGEQKPNSPENAATGAPLWTSLLSTLLAIIALWLLTKNFRTKGQPDET